MGFLVPAFAAFAVLAGIPILIHLFGRPHATRRPFAAIHFLLKSERKSAPQRKLREILLLAARALAIAAIPLILAKPYIETLSDLPGGMGVSEAAVIVLDDSRSMEMLAASGKTLFVEAQTTAQKLVDSMGRDSEAAVLLTSQGATPPVGELIADRTRLKQAIAAVHVTRRPGDTTATLKRAARHRGRSLARELWRSGAQGGADHAARRWQSGRQRPRRSARRRAGHQALLPRPRRGGAHRGRARRQARPRQRSRRAGRPARARALRRAPAR